MPQKFLKDFLKGFRKDLIVMSGPCAIESEEHALKSAETLKTICAKAGVKLIYKIQL